jgi:hypothetical protein
LELINNINKINAINLKKGRLEIFFVSYIYKWQSLNVVVQCLDQDLLLVVAQELLPVPHLLLLPVPPPHPALPQLLHPVLHLHQDQHLHQEVPLPVVLHLLPLPVLPLLHVLPPPPHPVLPLPVDPVNKYRVCLT